MSSGITEVVILPLKAGSDVHDPTSQTGKIMQECLNTALGVEGCQRAFWGTELENPATLRWMVDWDSVDSHQAFMKAPYVTSSPHTAPAYAASMFIY